MFADKSHGDRKDRKVKKMNKTGTPSENREMPKDSRRVDLVLPRYFIYTAFRSAIDFGVSFVQIQ